MCWVLMQFVNMLSVSMDPSLSKTPMGCCLCQIFNSYIFPSFLFYPVHTVVVSKTVHPPCLQCMWLWCMYECDCGVFGGVPRGCLHHWYVSLSVCPRTAVTPEVSYLVSVNGWIEAWCKVLLGAQEELIKVPYKCMPFTLKISNCGGKNTDWMVSKIT